MVTQFALVHYLGLLSSAACKASFAMEENEEAVSCISAVFMLIPYKSKPGGQSGKENSL